MKKILLGLLISNAALAGKFEVVGEGLSAKPAEFIKLKIQILAECSSSAIEVKKNVDMISQKVDLALQDFKNSSIGDQIQISLGGQSQQIKTEYIGSQSVVACDQNHSWTSTSTISFKLVETKLLASLQDALFNVEEKYHISGGTNQPRLHLQLSKPEPGVLADTWDAMSDEALKKAYQHALRQVTVISELQGNTQIELVKMTATQDKSGNFVYDQVTATGDTAGDSLGRVVVKISRLFTFNVK